MATVEADVGRSASRRLPAKKHKQFRGLAQVIGDEGRILHVNAAAQADAITEQKPLAVPGQQAVSANASSFNTYIVNVLKPKTVAYMGENTEFNKTVLELLRERLKAANIELVNVST